MNHKLKLQECRNNDPRAYCRRHRDDKSARLLAPACWLPTPELPRAVLELQKVLLTGEGRLHGAHARHPAWRQFLTGLRSPRVRPWARLVACQLQTCQLGARQQRMLQGTRLRRPRLYGGSWGYTALTLSEPTFAAQLTSDTQQRAGWTGQQQSGATSRVSVIRRQLLTLVLVPCSEPGRSALRKHQPSVLYTKEQLQPSHT
jgi:hypothetical protein